MTATPDPTSTAGERFRRLHEGETFVMPNPWDVGSARLLAGLGFPALATTSSGFAASLGRVDGQTSFAELLAHVELMATSVTVPLNVDAERLFAEDVAGVARNVEALGAAGAAGCSIEDWDPAAGAIDAHPAAVERVQAAAEAADRVGMVLTARAENHIRGVTDLDDTIARLVAYREAGADVVYAPGLFDIGQIATVVEQVGAPVNVLVLPAGPTVAELAAVGVRRLSTGAAWPVPRTAPCSRGRRSS